MSDIQTLNRTLHNNGPVESNTSYIAVHGVHSKSKDYMHIRPVAANTLNTSGDVCNSGKQVANNY